MQQILTLQKRVTVNSNGDNADVRLTGGIRGEIFILRLLLAAFLPEFWLIYFIQSLSIDAMFVVSVE